MEDVLLCAPCLKKNLRSRWYGKKY